MKQTLYFLPVALLLSSCGGGGGGASANGGPDTVPVAPANHVETLRLAPTQFEDLIELSGTIKALNDVVLSAQSSGMLESVTPLGSRVARDEVIAKLDDDQLVALYDQVDAQWENASVALQLAQENHDRQEPLYRDSIISALEFSQLEAGLEQAKANLRLAEARRTQTREQLADTEIRAPFSGRIEDHLVEVGEQVAPGTHVIRIVNASSAHIAMGVAERFAGDIEIGTEVQLDLSAYGLESRTGSVSFAGSVMDPDTRTFEVLATVDNSDGALKPEMVARAIITLALIDDVLVVPRHAVTRDEAGMGVFVVERLDDSLLARWRAVMVGSSYAGRLVVTDGLMPGDEVVVQGHTMLSDGDQLQIDLEYTELDAEGTPVTPARPAPLDSTQHI